MSEVATPTKERPILFNGEMVRAILDGRKTQTRRIVKPQLGTTPFNKFIQVEATEPDGWYYWWDVICGPGSYDVDQEYRHITCPYGAPGDELWVRETYMMLSFNDVDGYVGYKADGSVWVKSDLGGMHKAARNLKDERWRPSIHMPRWASRIQLRITDVRVERLQEIHELDAEEEGITGDFDQKLPSEYFKDLWNSINDKRGFGWDVNPWVWVVDFEVIRP